MRTISKPYIFGLRTSPASVRSLPCELSSQCVAGASSDRRRSVRPAPLSNDGRLVDAPPLPQH
eukprot:scaffold94700_cov65-Phaeocystis_antarctica.AAC.14